MNNEINLLHTTKKKTNTLLSKLAAIRMFSLSFLFLISFASISLFILIALSPLPSLQQRESDEAKTQSLFHDKVAKILLTKERIADISMILKTRPVIADTLQRLVAQVPDDFTVGNVKFDGEKVEFTVSTSSLAGVDALTANVVAFNKKEKKFSKVTLTGLSLNTDNGQYVVSFALEKV